MKYSLTTTPKTVVESTSVARVMRFSAGLFSTAVNVYIAPQGTKNVIVILNTGGATHTMIAVPAGVNLEAYTDAGTAELAVTKEECSMRVMQQLYG